MPQSRLSLANDFVERIARCDAIRDYIQENGLVSIPEFSLDEFKDARSSARRTRLQNSLINLLQNARVGDLIVLPEPKSMSRVHIGQISQKKVIRSTSRSNYGRIRLPSRAVDWLVSYPERAVSSALSSTLRQSYPFTVLEQSLYLEVFALAYDTYVYGDRHAATIFNGSEFLDADASLLSNITKIAAAACVALDAKKDIGDFTPSMLLNVLLRNPPIEYTSNQSSDIHSPGFTRYTSGTIVPLAVSSLLATFLILSSCSTKEEMQTKLDDIVYVNSSDNADPVCNARVSEANKIAIDMLGVDKTWEICKTARGAMRRKVRPSARPGGRRGAGGR